MLRVSVPMHLTLCCLLLLAASQLAAGDAAHSRGGVHRVGAAPEAADFAATGGLSLRFSANVVATPILAEPLLIGSDIIVVGRGSAEVGGVGATVVAIDATTGNARWTVPLPQPVVASAAYAEGRILIGTIGGTLHCLRLTTGEELWQVVHQGYQVAAPAIVGNSVVVSPGFGNDNLLAYDLESGSVIWSAPLERAAQSAPSVLGNNVIVILPNGTIHNFNLTTGLPMWANPIQTQGIFYGTSPALFTAADGSLIAMANPGGEEFATGSSVVGYRGYVAYRINITTGTFVKIVPGRAAAIAAAADAGDKPSGFLPGGGPEGGLVTSVVEPLELTEVLGQLPADLRAELSSLQDEMSMIEVVEKYEALYGVLFAGVKEALLDLKARRVELALRPVLAESGDAQTNALLPPSMFSTAWVSANTSRPGPVSYLNRGTNEFMVLTLREIPGETAKSRTHLFSMNPALGGTLRWHYSSTELDAPNAPGHPGALLVPKVGDANGAWVVAPLGSNIGIFDAAESNLPVADIDMPGVVFATPVLANGLLIVADMSGHLRVFETDNFAPTAPVVTAPANGQDVATGGGLMATWNSSTDNADLPSALTYTIRYAVNGQWDTDGTSVTLAAGALSYAFGAVPTDSNVEFAVRATDSRGAASPWSEPVNFVFQRDSRAPLPPRNVVVTTGPLEIRVAFDASLDEAPLGDADVVSYRAQFVQAQGGASFTVDLGLNKLLVINGASPSTPLVGGEMYYVTLYALDHRDNLSVAVVRSATPDALGSVDTLPPLVTSAILRDVNRDGRIDEVALQFSEAINTTTATFTGFKLGNTSPVAILRTSASELVLGFGSGVATTAGLQVTFDDTLGSVTDLADNALVSFGEADVVEVDAAAPVLLMSTLRVWDDNGDTHPNRITVDFSEPIQPSSLQLADIDEIRDSAGTLLGVVSVSLINDGRTLEVVLDGTTGTLSIPSIGLRDNGDGVFVSDGAGNTLFSGSQLAPPTLVVSPGIAGRTIVPGLIRLDATASTDPVTGGPLSYHWTIEVWSSQLTPLFRENDAVSFSGSNAGTVSLLLVEPGFYAVRLMVAAADGRTNSQLISLSVLNAAPKANIRAASVARIGESVTLWAGASSDANSSMNYQDLSTFAWRVTSQPDDASPVIANASAANATIEALNQPGLYEIELRVSDQAGASSTALHELQVLANGEVLPLASAGPDRRVSTAGTTTLSAIFSRMSTGSTYHWEELGGGGAFIANPESRDAQVTFPRAGVFRFRVTLTAPSGLWSSDDVTIEAFDAGFEYAPSLVVSALGVIRPGEALVLDFDGSIDVDGGALTFDVQHLSGPALYQLAPNTFTTLVEGESVLSVRAFDGQLYSMPREVRILSTNATTDLSIQAQIPEDPLTGTEITLPLSGVSSGEFWVRQVSGAPLTGLVAIGTALELQAAQPGMVTLEVWNTLSMARVDLAIRREGRPIPTAAVSATAAQINLERENTFQLVAGPMAQGLTSMWVQTAGPSAHIVAPMAPTTTVELPNVSSAFKFSLLVSDGDFLVEAGSVDVTTIKAAPPPTRSNDGSGCTLTFADSSLLGAALLFATLGAALFVRRRREDGVSATSHEDASSDN